MRRTCGEAQDLALVRRPHISALLIRQGHQNIRIGLKEECRNCLGCRLIVNPCTGRRVVVMGGPTLVLLLADLGFPGALGLWLWVKYKVIAGRKQMPMMVATQGKGSCTGTIQSRTLNLENSNLN
uniref:Uncharacterized protein n=1 Tax=Rhizophora mucronata TaxID=61149 RepID=A0A2P2P7P5_RHIMU